MSDDAFARRALALLDLTDLADDATEDGARDLCRRAVSGPVPVAAVCLWPRFVATARLALGDGPVRIATVVNFPEGGTPIAPVIRETEEALEAGADEIDLVLPWQAVLAGHTTAATAMLRNVRMRCGDRLLKVILETGEYPDLEKVRTAAELAIAWGADFIKTSTGKTARSASIPAARVMLNVIAMAGRPVGLKPSGGIRTLADAKGYLDLADAIMGPDWATPRTFRFGASGLHGALLAAIDGAAAGEAAPGTY
ncbi:deoxyribose-phosphate aldolase [Bosea sp. SSUT16]|jgi:deoxyribose-phosphate aldolase|uniref:Deoxyribose-phosphate aldolase n=1 Tax=Bosea spartocytisi TaxID=2773451 RepID=A0A927E6H2_9HYPH|nr:deoxyribose-phosphate aldolase [Bosea spartocytisi]MBD3845258.1 deoxyribose-phosphate aldolase [Bosea spartocytisi]MCT4472429.1 deoxyribose-phosphate aldolase [Bosea spartocytisi]